MGDVFIKGYFQGIGRLERLPAGGGPATVGSCHLPSPPGDMGRSSHSLQLEGGRCQGSGAFAKGTQPVPLSLVAQRGPSGRTDTPTSLSFLPPGLLPVPPTGQIQPESEGKRATGRQQVETGHQDGQTDLPHRN